MSSSSAFFPSSVFLPSRQSPFQSQLELWVGSCGGTSYDKKRNKWSWHIIFYHKFLVFVTGVYKSFYSRGLLEISFRTNLRTGRVNLILINSFLFFSFSLSSMKVKIKIPKCVASSLPMKLCAGMFDSIWKFIFVLYIPCELEKRRTCLYTICMNNF